MPKYGVTPEPVVMPPLVLMPRVASVAWFDRVSTAVGLLPTARSLVLVLLEIAMLVSQRIETALNTKQDKAIDDIYNAMVAMNQLDKGAPLIGYAPLNEDHMLHYRVNLGPKPQQERAKFPDYIDAIRARRYKTFHGVTRGLWTRIEDAQSAMGGIAFGPDWWDMAQSLVDLQGSILYNGVSTDQALLTSNFSDLVQAWGLDQDHAVLNSTLIDALLPHSSATNVTQYASLLYKQYSTDSQRLTSFNLRIANDQWTSNTAASDLATTSTCVLREKPTFQLFGGYWCPNTYYPSVAYKLGFVNASVGDWVVECDAPRVQTTINIIRWHSGMAGRYSTVFHDLSVHIAGPRKVVFTQKNLLRLAQWPNNASLPILDVVAIPYNGSYTPLPDTLFVVESGTLAYQVRTLQVSLALFCVLFTRCSLVGLRTATHFILETPLSIMVCASLAILTYPSGTELSVIICTMDASRSVLKVLVILALVIRPYTIPAMLLSKAFLSMGFGLNELAHCVTVREAMFMVMVQLTYLHHTASDVVAVGMKPGTTIDKVTQYIWRFHGLLVAWTLTFIIVRYLGGYYLSQALTRRWPQLQSSRTLTMLQRRPHFRRLNVKLRSGYDEYLCAKFFAFGVCVLPQEITNGRLCRVLDSSLFWLECVFNFNPNGIPHYGGALRPGYLINVSLVGVFDCTAIEAEGELKNRRDLVILM